MIFLLSDGVSHANVRQQQLNLLRSSISAAFAGLILESLLFGGLIVVYTSGLWKLWTRRTTSGLSTRDRTFLLASACLSAFAAVVRVTHLVICDVGTEAAS